MYDSFEDILKKYPLKKKLSKTLIPFLTMALFRFCLTTLHIKNIHINKILLKLGTLILKLLLFKHKIIDCNKYK